MVNKMLTKKSTVAIIVLLLILAISVIFIVTKPFSSEQIQIPDDDIVLFTSPENILENGEMEAFCQKTQLDPAKSYAVVDGVTRECAYTHTNIDGQLAPVGDYYQPYNWDFTYGAGMYRYDGVEEAPIGEYMTLLRKRSYGDWYGFGYRDIPVQEGKVYEGVIYAKRLLKEGDSRDCIFDIRFKNVAGQALDVDVSESSNLGVGNGDWGRVSAKATAPQTAAYGGFQIWCPQMGDYDYLIDGQFFGESSFCQPGESRQCGAYDTGACQFGVQTCSDQGTWGSCQNVINPVAEICDQVDNDCDGEVDEQLTCQDTGGGNGDGINLDWKILGIGGLFIVGIIMMYKKR